MKTLNVRVWCQAMYYSSIEVPDDLTLEEAFEYAREHIEDIPLADTLQYLPDSDELDDADLDNELVTFFEEKWK